MKTNLAAIYHHPAMQILHQSLGQQDHRTLVLWAIETGRGLLEIFTQTMPDDPRPAIALDAAVAWSRGEIKMPAAKIAARETHQAAKAVKAAENIQASQRDAAAAVAHAMGQIIGVVHVGTHSTAYAAYAVQAKVLLHSQNPKKDSEEMMAEMVDYLSKRLEYWSEASKDGRPWANFL